MTCQQKQVMNRASTLFLKFVLCAIALGALAICIFVLPALAADDAARHPELAYQQYPFLAYAYILCITFLFALYQGFKLLTYADANNVFSEASVRALRNIKFCAIIVCTMIVAGVGTLLIMAAGKDEDMTGIVMMGLIITVVSIVGASFVAVLQRHVQKAIELKSENDLTV